jgi:hypothetical protein
MCTLIQACADQYTLHRGWCCRDAKRTIVCLAISLVSVIIAPRMVRLLSLCESAVVLLIPLALIRGILEWLKRQQHTFERLVAHVSDGLTPCARSSVIIPCR